MRTVIAQGGGFYGCGFFTTEATPEQIITALEAAGMETKNASSPDIRIWAHYKPTDTGLDIQIAEPGFPLTPNPIILLDTGHYDEDLAALNLLKQELDKLPHGIQTMVGNEVRPHEGEWRPPIGELD